MCKYMRAALGAALAVCFLSGARVAWAQEFCGTAAKSAAIATEMRADGIAADKAAQMLAEATPRMLAAGVTALEIEYVRAGFIFAYSIPEGAEADEVRKYVYRACLASHV